MMDTALRQGFKVDDRLRWIKLKLMEFADHI
jgi:hypothetical protein